MKFFTRLLPKKTRVACLDALTIGSTSTWTCTPQVIHWVSMDLLRKKIESLMWINRELEDE